MSEEKTEEVAASAAVAEAEDQNSAEAAGEEEAIAATIEETSAKESTGEGEESAEVESGGADDRAVSAAEFGPLTNAAGGAPGDNLRLLMDVMVSVSVELGVAKLPLKSILGLGQGAIVKLDRTLGEPFEIRVNGELVGKGEVVVVDDQFGVRVTELVATGGGE